ncbi:MAG: hypothetical protein FJX74_02950 [Armatimonadetes bacterium]|nr:hypothetical protein [Armatimonadota bacterium]
MYTHRLWLLGCLVLGGSLMPALVRADVIVAYEVVPPEAEGGDIDILARLLKADGTLGWEAETPTVLASSAHAETSPVVVADGEGGAFVIYELTFTEGEHKGDMDLVAQHIGADGTLLWNDGEQPVGVATSTGRESHPVALGDGAGGFIVAYEWQGEDGDVDVLAQRMSAEGESRWATDDAPALVGVSPGRERNPVLVPDGAGGVLVLFEWEGPDGTTDVMAQRVTAEGRAAWNNGEQAVDVSASPSNERAVTAVADGAGGALVAFELEFLEGEFKGDVDVMGQRITGDGVVVWNGGEQPSLLASGKGIERHPQAIGDGAGGMMVLFEYEPLEGEFAGDIDIMAQRVDSNGRLLWHDGEQSAAVSAAGGLERAPQLVPLSDGSAIAVLEHEFRNGENAGDIDVVGQRLSREGQLLWNGGEQSTMLSGAKWLERTPVALADGEGGAIVVLTAVGPEGEFEGDEDVWALRVSQEGQLLWHNGEQSVEIAGSDLLERRPGAAVVQ